MNKIIKITVSAFVLLFAVQSFGMEQWNKRPAKRVRVAENNMDVAVWQRTPWEITDHVALQSIKSDPRSGFVCVNQRYLKLARNLQKKCVKINKLNRRPTLGFQYQYIQERMPMRNNRTYCGEYMEELEDTGR